MLGLSSTIRFVGTWKDARPTSGVNRYLSHVATRSLRKSNEESKRKIAFECFIHVSAYVVDQLTETASAPGSLIARAFSPFAQWKLL
jgi:hypothetical protein